MGRRLTGNGRQRPRGVHAPVAVCLVLLVVILAGPPSDARAQAAEGTPTATPAATAAPTSTPVARPTPTLTPTATPVPAPHPVATPTPPNVARERVVPASTAPRKHARRRHKRREKTATATPIPTRQAAPAHHHKKHARRRRTAKATPTITPSPTTTPTSIPPISLQAEDSIRPVQCNGQAKPEATHPFLTPPFRGWTSIVSYFDHDLPDFAQDGLVTTATGLQAAPDSQHVAVDFPAYWNGSVRQYLYYDGHNGYDYNLWYQPVYAAAPGKVIYAAFEYADAPDHGYGKMVMVDHGHGYITLYGHFSKLLVKPGQRVKRAQELGISGNTGHSSGPHLHFTVFHNCTPTDPYGWTGTDQDPLASYQGETSIYLWMRPPLVINPLPHWPGMSALPATSIERLLLLKLPSTGKGTHAFVSALRRETNRVLAALLGRDRGNTTGARADLLHGAVDVTAAVSPEQLYALPDAVSIASTDVADDARVDVLNALARAALATPHRRLRLASSLWTGYLFQWDGRTFLVGAGAKGKQVHLRLARGKRSIVDVVKADPTSGAYAVDLGRLSKSQIASLRADLQGRHRRRSSLQVQPVQADNQRRAADVRPRHSSSGPGSGVVAALALCLLALLAAGFGAGGWLRRRATRWQ